MIEITNLTHIYRGGTVGVKDVNLTIETGEIVSLIGVSGAGKSTLLRCINRLLEPTSGSILIDGEDILNCPEKDAQVLRRKIGMVFQNFNLLQRSLSIQNVLLGRLGYIHTLRSMIPRYTYSKEDKNIAMNCLSKVGIEDLANRRIEALSGGQQQRVGIARALAQKPTIILGDEPVSNLDPSRKREIMSLLKGIHEHESMTTIISIHDIELAKRYTNRLIGVVGGEIIFDGKPEELSDEATLDIFA